MKKVRGLYVTEDESAGLRIPDGGVVLDIEQYSQLDKGDYERMSYICDAAYDKDKKPILWLDAHPSQLNKVWIGSLVNAASKGETVHAMLNISFVFKAMNTFGF